MCHVLGKKSYRLSKYSTPYFFTLKLMKILNNHHENDENDNEIVLNFFTIKFRQETCVICQYLIKTNFALQYTRFMQIRCRKIQNKPHHRVRRDELPQKKYRSGKVPEISCPRSYIQHRKQTINKTFERKA